MEPDDLVYVDSTILRGMCSLSLFIIVRMLGRKKIVVAAYGIFGVWGSK